MLCMFGQQELKNTILVDVSSKCETQKSAKSENREIKLSAVLDTAHKRRVPNTATCIAQACNRPVVAKSLELVLHCLR